MKSKSALFKISTRAVILTIAVISSIFLVVDPFNYRVPKDEMLISNFQAHRVQFLRLGQMVLEDSDRQSYFAKSDLDKINPESRKQEYKTNISEIDSDLIVTSRDGKTVSFMFAVGGLLAIGPGWSKGIVYMPENPDGSESFLPALDNARKLPAGEYLRQIEPNWFLFYERTDD